MTEEMNFVDVVAAKYDGVDIFGVYIGTTFVWPDPWIDTWDEGTSVLWEDRWRNQWSITDSEVTTRTKEPANGDK